MAYLDPNIVLIEVYRNFEISFNKQDATFSAWSDYNDTEFGNKSFKAIKKGVDDYIKKNESFKPFKIVKVFGYRGVNIDRLEETILISGIRKDNKFTYVDEEGKKKILSDYNEKKFALWQTDFSKLKRELEDARLVKLNAINAFLTKEKAICKELDLLNPIKLTDYKKENFNND